eukprot:6422088-Prymnesium_polylepis.1
MPRRAQTPPLELESSRAVPGRHRHSHNQWTEAVRWYVNASAAQLSLGGGGALGSPGWLHRDGAAELLPHLDRSGVAP